jgi:hypothetical protein
MQSRSIPCVTLYIRIGNEKGKRRYERVNRRNPQLNCGVYCLHFYILDGKRKWTTVRVAFVSRRRAECARRTYYIRRSLPQMPPVVSDREPPRVSREMSGIDFSAAVF